ncbi:hypothetical protein BRADI_1g57216v3 [Brachypodium distachyon]|uniref:Uncharacterized protein n=1 Tax=Brachypodium distachyon TaxID=15368 RepID=A0A0Q3NTS1_BRADI|nr:hypothetical protein BRADI_1g57216v3 [Brachypodium distachyon]
MPPAASTFPSPAGAASSAPPLAARLCGLSPPRPPPRPLLLPFPCGRRRLLPPRPASAPPLPSRSTPDLHLLFSASSPSRTRPRPLPPSPPSTTAARSLLPPASPSMAARRILLVFALGSSGREQPGSAAHGSSEQNRDLVIDGI